ncbi:MAG: cytochrome d ubiquinol oxidase subunit II [Xanthomonadaceae bacterium]|nr:cytochrome d ubiquinol oxidase subunit II [Xanthomonadaceae bacterium]
MFDYGTMREIWWLLLGVLLIGFALTDGYDLGVGAILRLLGKDDVERRMVIEAIEPNWEGNQVWFILGGGAIFAAWPALYAVSFSGFYFAMLLVLLALILRPVGFVFRNKLPNPAWRNTWDWALTIAGAVPSLVFGVAFGNLFLGAPFQFSDDMRVSYDGGLLDLLSPFALLAGGVSLSMLVMHGASFVAMRVEHPIGARARRIARIAAAATVVTFVAAGVWLLRLDGHVITSAIDPLAASNPLYKQVGIEPGGWLGNYQSYPWTMAAPIAVVVGLLGVVLARRPGLAFIASGLSVTGVILTAGFSLFPFLLPSSSHPAHGLTVWDASSSELTLKIMLLATAVLLPIVLAYTTWAFRVMRGQVTRQHVIESEDAY